MTGQMLGWCSVLLVSLAQLMLRAAMIHLPPVGALLTSPVEPHLASLLLLVAGLAAYALSMLCWMVALRYLPLNRLYPLLSMSYVLVWLAAMALPWFAEPFSWPRLAGVILIVTGLLCVTIPSRRASKRL